MMFQKLLCLYSLHLILISVSAIDLDLQFSTPSTHTHELNRTRTFSSPWFWTHTFRFTGAKQRGRFWFEPKKTTELHVKHASGAELPLPLPPSPSLLPSRCQSPRSDHSYLRGNLCGTESPPLPHTVRRCSGFRESRPTHHPQGNRERRSSNNKASASSCAPSSRSKGNSRTRRQSGHRCQLSERL